MVDISDSYTLYAPRDRVWDALIDPDTLKRTVPGCELLKQAGDNAYTVRLNVGVAGRRDIYDGTLHLLDVRKPETCRMVVEGAGTLGTLRSDAALRLEARDDDTTIVHCTGRAQLGDPGTGAGQDTEAAGDTANTLIRQYFDQLADLLPGAAPAIASPEGDTAPDEATAPAPTPSPAPVAAEPEVEQPSRRRQTSSRARKPKAQPAAAEATDTASTASTANANAQTGEQNADTVSGSVAQTGSRKSSRSGTSRRRGESSKRKSTRPEQATTEPVETGATAEITEVAGVAEVAEVAGAPASDTLAVEDVKRIQSSGLTTPSEDERVDSVEATLVVSPLADEVALPEREDAAPPAHLDVLPPAREEEVADVATIARPAASAGTPRIAQVTYVGRRPLSGDDSQSTERTVALLGILIAIFTVALAALLVWFVVGGMH